jgi:HAE1 family hydrophobic/amphiphilic exporter-1
MVRLADVAKPVEISGPASINRQDRGRYIQVSAGLNPDGKGGLNKVIQDIDKIFASGEIKLPQGVKYEYWGQAQDFQDLAQNMLVALILAILFIYLVLASLYESFITPFTIMLVLPLAVCGAFYSLAIMRSSLDIFSIIGCILLLGIATKNSILLVDYTNQLD